MGPLCYIRVVWLLLLLKADSFLFQQWQEALSAIFIQLMV